MDTVNQYTPENKAAALAGVAPVDPAAWKNIPKRKVLKGSVRDKVVDVGHILRRDIPGSTLVAKKFFGKKRSREMTRMEPIQEVVNGIADKLGLRNIFAPDRLLKQTSETVKKEASRDPAAAAVANSPIPDKVDEQKAMDAVKEAPENARELTAPPEKRGEKAQVYEERLEDAHKAFKAQEKAEAMTKADKMGLASLGLGLGGTVVGMGGATLAGKLNTGVLQSNGMATLTTGGKVLDAGGRMAAGALNLAGDIVGFKNKLNALEDHGKELGTLDIIETMGSIAEDVGNVAGDTYRMSVSKFDSPITGSVASIVKNTGAVVSNAVSAGTNLTKAHNIQKFKEANEEEHQSEISKVKDSEKTEEQRQQDEIREADRATERVSEHLAHSSAKHKGYKGLLHAGTSLASAILNVASAATNGLVGGQDMFSASSLLGYAALGINYLGAFIGDLILDHFNEATFEKTVDRQIDALLKMNNETSQALNANHIKCYSDLKKVFEYHFHEAAQTGALPASMSKITNKDFKSLMSFALCGQSGGKAGLHDAIAQSRAEAINRDAELEGEDGNELSERDQHRKEHARAMINLMGLRMSNDGPNGKAPRAATIAQRLNKREKPGLGEYRGTQYMEAQ